MNILGMVLPTLVFRQKGQQQTLTTNGSMSKCSSSHSAVGDTSSYNSSQKAKKKTTLDGKSTQTMPNSGSCQRSSNGSNEGCILSDGSVMTSSSGLISNMLKGEVHVKKHATKKKRKKKKNFGKRSSRDVSSVAVAQMADHTCSELENTYRTAETLPSLFVGETGDSTDGINPNCSRITQTISVSEEIKPSLASADGQCTSTRRESADTFVLKESVVGSAKLDFSRNTSDSKKVEKCSSTRSKQDRTFPGSVTFKDGNSECSHGSSKCIRNCSDKVSNSSSSLAQFCVSSSPLSNNGSQNIDICQGGSKENICKASRQDVNEGKVIFDCNARKFEEAPENHCVDSLSETKFAGANSEACSSVDENMCKRESNADRDGSIVGIKLNKASCGISEIAIAKASKSTKQDQRHNPNGMLHTHGCLNNLAQNGKENSNLSRQRVYEKIGQRKTYGRKEYMRGDWCRSFGLQEAALLAERNFFSRPSGFTENFRGFEPYVYPKVRNHRHIPEETSWWVPQHKLLDKVGQQALVRCYPARNKERGSIEKLGQSFTLQKCVQCRKDFLVGKSNIHRPQTKAAFEKRVMEFPSIEHNFRSSSAGEITQDSQWDKHNLSEIHNLRILDSASSDRPSTQMLSNPLNVKVKNSACFKSNLPHDKNVEQDTVYREKPLKQIPVGFVTAINYMKGEATKESQGGVACEAPNLQGIRTGVECPDRLALTVGICLGDKSINATSCFRMNDHSVCIGSQMAFQILDASYRSQIASECVLSATGNPVAEFEKLLNAVSPVIFLSSLHRHYGACITNQCIPDVISRHDFSDVPLADVWSWYEEHGNYGLEVKVKPSWNLKKASSEGVPFHAYFVPSLSAVQLFCHSQHPKDHSNPRNDTVVAKKSQDGICSLHSAIVDHSLPENFHPDCSKVGKLGVTSFPKSMEHKKPSLFKSSHGNPLHLTPDISSFDDSELLFEYFEHERPEQRKPLCAKIKELVDLGTSNHQIHGDPSKLECMNLEDLHPASWYSVAWYPIYRIPEGTFRASFLTYHSLGHLVKRCIRSDSMESVFCIVSPVLGMESYHAQGECWFHLSEEAGQNFSRSGLPFNSSEILEKRLRTLEAAAAIFSRGSVYKNQAKIRNKHPDYEFFLSRK